MLNGKATITAGSIKRTQHKWFYFPEPKSFVKKVKVELDLSNYATKADLKNGTGVYA